MKNLFSFLLLFIVGIHTFAQKTTQQDSTKTHELDNIVVTANRSATHKKEVPVAISKITAKTIAEAKPTSISEVINKAAGVLMVNLGNEQHSMSIRQPLDYSNYYLYMEDGLPIRPMGVFNHNALLEVNQFAVNNIEVVKGPVSSIYGPEAVGGAINFITQNPTKNPTMKVGIQADQFGYRRLQMAGGATIGKFGFYVAGLSSRQTDSWFTYSDYNKDAINLKLDYKISDRTKLDFTYMKGDYYSQQGTGVDSVAFYNKEYKSTTDFTYRKVESERTKLGVTHQWNTNSNSFLTLFQRNNNIEQNPAYAIRYKVGAATATGQINNNRFKSYGFIIQHNQHFDFLNSNLIAGGMLDYTPNSYYAYQTDLSINYKPVSPGIPANTIVDTYQFVAERPDIVIANYDAKIKNSATYVQYDFMPLEGLKIVLGGRFDQMAFDYNNYLGSDTGDKSYTKFTFKTGLTYKVNSDLSLYGNFAQGFAPPGLSAIFRIKPKENPTDPTEFYTNLKAAEFNNYEIGGWYNIGSKIAIETAFYRMDGKDELLSIRQSDNSYDYQSAGKTLHQGIEFNFVYNPNHDFNFRFGGTYAEHKYIEFDISSNPNDAVQNLDGKWMLRAPKWIWNSEVTYKPKFLKGLRTALEWQFLDKYYNNQVNTNTYEGYSILNFRIGYQIKGIELYTNIMNLTDELYAYNVSRGNAVKDISNYTPAAPRTFMMGLQYNFELRK